MADLPPERRRWWSWWSEAAYAEDEWRELTLFAADLGRAEQDIRTIVRGMGSGVAHTPIASMATKLSRLARRWERRADAARQDAIADHAGDRDWLMAAERKVSDDLAESLMARGINALMDAERLLDEETRARAQVPREALQEVYTEVHDRDVFRRLRREY